MLFPTLSFALFFVAVFMANWLLRPRAIEWRVAMLVASFFFYGWWNWKFLFLLGGSILGNWFLGRMVVEAEGGHGSTRRSRAIVSGAVALNLLVLGVFKYYGFFVEELHAQFGSAVDFIPMKEITLPVGISFFTFQAMGYVIDIGRGQIKAMPLLDFAVYLSFFPQLVAGPIVRASEFAPQLAERPDPRHVQSAEAFRLIFAGLFKKVVISTYLASEIVDEVFNLPEAYSGLEILVAVYAYAIQIYADFSGYTDIAIGVALLLGFRFPQNFNAPYTALSIQDFWRRWHITLSNWLRDYLYIPLGGNRGSKLFTYRNLLVTMLLGGLWHGAAWNFVIWGAIHGGMLAVERAVSEWRRTQGMERLLPPVASNVVRWLFTFNVVCLAWIFFRAETFDQATTMITGIFDWEGSSALVTPLLLLVIIGSILTQFVPAATVKRAEGWFSEVGWALQGVALGIGIVIVDILGPEGVAPFIYFQF